MRHDECAARIRQCRDLEELRDSAAPADIHYRLALLYDDKMNDPLNALHHFKRFLTLSPTGKRAEEVKRFMKRDELTLITQLSGDTILTQREAAQLRDDNLTLRKRLEENWAREKAAREAARTGKPTRAPNEKQEIPANARTYTVERGDTLASISRKFYKSSGRWQRILAANPGILKTEKDLRPGQTLVIP